jgi:hypothetical protein
MGKTVGQIIEGTFVVLILAWVLTRSADFGQVASSLGGQYVAAINALKPSGA